MRLVYRLRAITLGSHGGSKSYGEDSLSAERIIAQLTAASQRLEEAQTRLREAGEAASQARTLVAGALRGSSGQLVGQLGSLVDAVGQVSNRTPILREQVQQTITKVKALGKLDGGGGSGTSQPPLTRSPRPTPNAAPKSRQQRDRAEKDPVPTPQRERVSAEAIGFGAAVASAAWAAVSEFMAVQTKTVVGTILAIAAATSAGKALLEKRQERKNKDEDQ